MTKPPAALIVFDDGKGDLGPLTDLRPSFACRTGADTTLETQIAFEQLDEPEFFSRGVTADFGYLRFVNAPLPRTASGKILKRQLREEAVAALGTC